MVCVLCGCRCDLVGLCYGLKEPGDTEEASPQRGLLQGLHFPDRLSPAPHVLECVLLCSLFISNQFLHPSILPVLLPPTILPFLSPLPTPSIPLFHWESYRSSPRPNQFSSESSPVSRGPRLQHWNYLSSYFISYHTHTALAHTHHLHSLSEYALHVQSTRTFFFSVYLHSPQLHSPTSFWSGCWCFLWGGGVSGRESWSCFNQWELFQWGLSLSLCIVQVITTAWYSHKLGRRAGFSLRGRKEVWGRMDERWWRRREKRCYLASRSRGQHCCAAAAKSYQGSSGELFHSQPHSSPHTISHSTILSLFLSHDVNASILFFSRVTFS